MGDDQRVDVIKRIDDESVQQIPARALDIEKHKNSCILQYHQTGKKCIGEVSIRKQIDGDDEDATAYLNEVCLTSWGIGMDLHQDAAPSSNQQQQQHVAGYEFDDEDDAVMMSEDTINNTSSSILHGRRNDSGNNNNNNNSS